MPYEETYHEKIYLQNLFSKLNERSAYARVEGNPTLYFDLILTMYKKIPPRDRKKIDKRIKTLIHSMNSELERKDPGDDSLMDQIRYEADSNQIIFKYADKIHDIVMNLLDSHNLLLRRRIIHRGSEEGVE